MAAFEENTELLPEVLASLTEPIQNDLTYLGKLSADTFSFWSHMGYRPLDSFPKPPTEILEWLKTIHPIHVTIAQIEIQLNLPPTGSLEQLVTNYKEVYYTHDLYPTTDLRILDRCWHGAIQHEDLSNVIAIINSGRLTLEQLKSGLNLGATQNKVESIRTIFPYLNRVVNQQLKYLISDVQIRATIIDSIVIAASESGNGSIVKLVMEDEIMNLPINQQSRIGFAKRAFTRAILTDQPGALIEEVLSLISDELQVGGVERAMREKHHAVAKILIDRHRSGLESGVIGTALMRGAETGAIEMMEYILKPESMEIFRPALTRTIMDLARTMQSEEFQVENPRCKLILRMVQSIDDLSLLGHALFQVGTGLLIFLAQHSPIVAATANSILATADNPKLYIRQLALVTGAASKSWNHILVWACQYNILSVAKMALEKGANPHYHNDTPINTARTNGFDELVSYLESYHRPFQIRNIFR